MLVNATRTDAFCSLYHCNFFVQYCYLRIYRRTDCTNLTHLVFYVVYIVYFFIGMIIFFGVSAALQSIGNDGLCCLLWRRNIARGIQWSTLLTGILIKKYRLIILITCWVVRIPLERNLIFLYVFTQYIHNVNLKNCPQLNGSTGVNVTASKTEGSK